ncbi:MAG TPA: hypothetical protein VK645_07215 [Chitinophagaceae bacterium]|nr:hypothetical protein [Chitinophagaceae bacterium]
MTNRKIPKACRQSNLPATTASSLNRYLIIFSENSMVVKKSKESPPRKIISAICSKKTLFLLMPRIDKKENIQLAIKKMMATMVTSSIIVFSDLSSSFNEVSTIKHMPSKLEEAFKICGDFSFCPFTRMYFELEEAVRLQVKNLPNNINTVIELLFNQ